MSATSISKLRWLVMLSSPLVCLIFCCLELWQHHPAHHFFPLALIAGVLLVCRKVKGLGERSFRAGVTGKLAALHLVLALVAFVLDSPFVAGLAVLAAASAFDVAIRSLREEGGNDFHVTALALFLVPPPLGLDEGFRQLIGGWATRLSQVWLDELGVLNLVEGSIVVTAGKRFFVNDACSGINSMLVALCVAVIFCAWNNRSWIHTALLLVCTALAAVASNALRMLAVIYGSVQWGLGLDQGLAHELVGGASFLLDLLLVWSADNGLRFLLHQASLQATVVGHEPFPVPTANVTWISRPSLAVASIGMVLVVAPQLFQQVAHAMTAPAAATTTQDFTLPPQLGEWRRQGDKPIENAVIGDLSVRNVVWLYRRGGIDAYVAVNFPFVGFHDTRLCYLGQGWRLQKQQDRPMSGENDNTLRELELFHPVEHHHASLRLMVFDQTGNALPYHQENLSSRFGGRWLQRWNSKADTRITYTLQLLVPESPLDAAATTAVDGLFQEARAHVSATLAGSSRTLSAPDS